ncbi:hypothetical protein PAL_GLEAN10013272 [Pteropus alecto]|uniref:Uncharacterized protein n=1 Tax=Pteropus alecto TaxID=9402 RepID=L5KHK1_PTEAL|nr:hypothetical protein PAL_GLEAN10013272 [Pteropus alecto]
MTADVSKAKSSTVTRSLECQQNVSSRAVLGLPDHIQTDFVYRSQLGRSCNLQPSHLHWVLVPEARGQWTPAHDAHDKCSPPRLSATARGSAVDLLTVGSFCLSHARAEPRRTHNHSQNVTLVSLSRL